MAIIGSDPTAADLSNLVKYFQSISAKIGSYLDSPAGKSDPSFNGLNSTILSINDACDNISTKILSLIVSDGGKAVATINTATDKLNAAIATRAAITKDLTVMQNVASLAAAIATGSPAGIVSSGTTLIGSL